jgi:hypothetical protein
MKRYADEFRIWTLKLFKKINNLALLIYIYCVLGEILESKQFHKMSLQQMKATGIETISQNFIATDESYVQNITVFLMSIFKFIFQYVTETTCQNHTNERRLFQRTGHLAIEAVLLLLLHEELTNFGVSNLTVLCVRLRSVAWMSTIWTQNRSWGGGAWTGARLLKFLH